MHPWRNWQPRKIQVLMPKGVGVQLPLGAPDCSGSIREMRRKTETYCKRVLGSLIQLYSSVVAFLMRRYREGCGCTASG
jgi:hypothetical protein